MYMANTVQMKVGKNWEVRTAQLLILCAIGLHTFAGHHLRKRYAAIRRARELAIVAFWDQDAMLPDDGGRSLDEGHGMNGMGAIKRVSRIRGSTDERS